MENFLSRPEADRRAVFVQTAAKMGRIDPSAVEKDFWICLFLKRLFESPLGGRLVFKGGTSLSKAFHLIERFSEDIDLVLDSRSNPVGELEPATSRKREKKFVEALVAWSEREVRETVLPAVAALCPPGCAAAPVSGSPGCIAVSYPKLFASSYLRAEILLEIGARGAWVPHGARTVAPVAAERYPGLFRQPSASVVATLPERTFWEKVAVLHSLALLPDDRPVPRRASRHCYDAVMLARSPDVRTAALGDPSLPEDVIAFSDRYFRQSWTHDRPPRPGSVRLVPPPRVKAALRDDYAAMREMFWGEAPAFDALLGELRQLESDINSIK